MMHESMMTACGPHDASRVMAALEVRRSRARGVLAALNAVVFALGIAVLLSASQASGTNPAQTAPPTMSQVAGLPPGAAPCPVLYTQTTAPFNAGAGGTPMTSCPFVEQVRGAYDAASVPVDSEIHPLRVTSPKTRKGYDLVCVATGSYVTCSGGQYALIYLYNK
jgi:hypothetical protein